MTPSRGGPFCVCVCGRASERPRPLSGCLSVMTRMTSSCRSDPESHTPPRETSASRPQSIATRFMSQSEMNSFYEFYNSIFHSHSNGCFGDSGGDPQDPVAVLLRLDASDGGHRSYPGPRREWASRSVNVALNGA